MKWQGSDSRIDWQGIPLPLSLAPIGLPGCNILTGPVAVDNMPWTTRDTRAVQLAIPNASTLVGLEFFHQAVLMNISGLGWIWVSAGRIGVR